MSLPFVVVLFMVVYVLSVSQLYIITPEDNEYCQWETFNASCTSSTHPDHVIMMTSARYGRMRFGRCMREDHGSVGCSADVLAHLDRLCSGRRQCLMPIPDATLHANHPCPKELMPYLEATYTCIKLSGINRHACALYGGHVLKSDAGYLMPGGHLHASTVMGSPTSSQQSVASPSLGPAPGTAGCPWQIRARPGQRINLTLYNLDRDTGVLSATKCAVQRLVVQDRNRTLEGAVCNDKRRERHLYTSEGSELNIYVQHSSSPRGSSSMESQILHGMAPPAFVIRYQVIGCPDIVVNDNAAWVRRHGDTAVVRCNYTGETFYVTCLETEWKGELSACTKVIPTSSGHKVEKVQSYTQGILVVIGIGVALGVAIGVIVLFSVLFCLRRAKYTEESRYRVNARLLANSGGSTCQYDVTKYGGVLGSALIQYSDGTGSAGGVKTPEHQVIQLTDLCPFHQRMHIGPSSLLPRQSSVENTINMATAAAVGSSSGDGRFDDDRAGDVIYRVYSGGQINSDDGDDPDSGGFENRLIDAEMTPNRYGTVGRRSTVSGRRSMVTFKPMLTHVVGTGHESMEGSSTVLVHSVSGSCASLDLIKHFQQQQQQQQRQQSGQQRHKRQSSVSSLPSPPEVEMRVGGAVASNDFTRGEVGSGLIMSYVTSMDT